MQYIEHMKGGTETQQYDLEEELAILKTEKKRMSARTDRFLIPKQGIRTDRTKKVRERENGDRNNSKETSYESYLTDNMFYQAESESLRKFTLHKTSSKTTRSAMGLRLKILRSQQITPFRKFKVLGWKDNYYTNLLDWSYNNFVVAGYLNDLCLYNMAIDDEFESSLYRKFGIGVAGEYLTSVKCSPSEMKIALGYSSGSFKIYDYFKEKVIYAGQPHVQRIGTIQWSSGTIITGSKDQYLRSFDPRTKKIQEWPGQVQKAHGQEVCGVRQRGNYISSGGNDNKVNIYDVRKLKVLHSYAHGAAVKAMTWIGDKNLVTGGGTADKKLKFWSELQGNYKQIDTGSQICSLCWSPSTNEIVSCQGFSLNQIIIWNKKGERQYTFHGHSSRVLYSALSPYGQYLASGAGDQNLKIWKLFPSQESQQLLLNQEIR